MICRVYLTSGAVFVVDNSRKGVLRDNDKALNENEPLELLLYDRGASPASMPPRWVSVPPGQVIAVEDFPA